jgi:hypothetical protein
MNTKFVIPVACYESCVILSDKIKGKIKSILNKLIIEIGMVVNSENKTNTDKVDVAYSLCQ